MQNGKTRIEVSAGGIVYRKLKGFETSAMSLKDHVEWLVTQHSGNKSWGFPKGIVGDTVDNEPMADAAIREVGEEGGIVAKIVNQDYVTVNYQFTNKGILVLKTVHYFLMEYLSGNPDDHDWEVSEAKFLPAPEVKAILTYPSDLDAFEKLFG